MARKPTDIAAQLLATRGLDDEPLLGALLAAYRGRPLAELVELIEAVGQRCKKPLALRGSLNEQHAVWLAAGDARDPATLDGLIETLVTGRVEYSLERIAKLGGWPADPRLATRLLELVEGRRAISKRTFWQTVFQLISKNLHPGNAASIARQLQMRPQTVLEKVLVRRLGNVAARLDKLSPPSPSTAEREALAVLGKRLAIASERAAVKTEEDFLKEIWAAPLDDGPREVFADWLQQRGDPRGELIVLQLAIARGRPGDPEQKKRLTRVRALLAEHGRKWMGPLEPVVMAEHVFVRGFLHAARVSWRKLAAAPHLMTHPAWATVREYKIDPEGEQSCDAWIEHMIALKVRR